MATPLGKRLNNALLSLKGYNATFITTESGTTYNANSSELKDLLQALSGDVTDHNLIELFHCVPEIFAPVHAVAFRVASGVFQVKKYSDDSVIYENKQLNKLLSTPNPLQNFQQLIYEAVVYELVTGKNFLFHNVPDTLAFDYKNIQALWNLWANKITVNVNLENNQLKLLSATELKDLVKHYKLEGRDKPIEPERILFTHEMTLEAKDNKLNGKSPLASAKKAIANLIAVYEARNVIYTKRGALGFIVSRKSDASGQTALSPKEKKAILDELQEKYGLKKAKSLVGVSDAPVDFVRIAMSIAELQPFEETQADALAIASVLGVDKDLLPLPDGTTFENKKYAERSLYQNVCIPRAKSWAQTLTNFWQLEKYGLYLDVSFDHIEVLQENKKEKSEVTKNNVESFTKLYEKGLITKNQALINCGLEPLDQTGDVFITDVKNDTPLAVRLGVGGTEALKAIITDPNLTEEQKKNTLIILFGLPEDQAAMLAVGNGANATNNPNTEEDEETAD